MKWIKDEEFIRDQVPMTKEVPRMLTCSFLGLEPGDHFLDIGAGSGSISIQMALLGAQVTAVESKKEAVDLIKKNAQKFKVDLDLVHGMAPEACPDQVFDGIFIGGNRGQMLGILDYAHHHLKAGGSLVANFVTLANVALLRDWLRDQGYSYRLDLINHSQEDRLGILRGQNPIFIVKGVKK
ncbi:MAG: precorrin-6Y C5,15-methyltransferase (decarboxylating) subunit CbiT [Tissierellia bacterium]|nr:precorrin-6Y C5,15-methyltransferase (decarboxylating) subunit CbiT [Tissierellia bacterium]